MKGMIIYMESYATLRSQNEYTIFKFNGQIIRFMTSPRLERYTKIIEWDYGYLVVMAKYQNMEETEEYIDLIPILENLYYDVEEFLRPIERVEIDYGRFAMKDVVGME